MQLFIVALVLFVLITGLLGFWIFKTFIPEHYFKAYPLIPFFFFFFGLAFVAILNFSKKDEGVSAKALMISKGVKMIGSIIIILFYFLIVKTQLVQFAFTYIAFYFAYLIFETTALAMYQKRNKEVQ